MGSSFSLELDTTGPQIEVYAPRYAPRQLETEILIEGSEELSPNHVVYIVDAEGTRYDMTFSHEGNRLRGVTNFNEFPLGAAHIYAICKDTVDNLSNQASRMLVITAPANLAQTTRVTPRKGPQPMKYEREHRTRAAERPVGSAYKGRRADSGTAARKLGVTVRE